MASTLIYGFHSVEAVLRERAKDVHSLHVLKKRNDKRLEKMVARATGRSIPIEMMDRAAMDQLAEGGTHQGVIARVEEREQIAGDLETIIESSPQPLILVLDGVQDPHNLGACLRTADATGVDAIIIPKRNAVGVTPTVERVAAGAAESVPVIAVTNLARTLERLGEAGVWMTGTDDEAEDSLYEADLTGPTAIVMGSEQSGVRSLTGKHCDRMVHIPMAGSVSSLNVSVAAGVVLFEAIRQRNAR